MINTTYSMAYSLSNKHGKSEPSFPTPSTILKSQFNIDLKVIVANRSIEVTNDTVTLKLRNRNNSIMHKVTYYPADTADLQSKTITFDRGEILKISSLENGTRLVRLFVVGSYFTEL